MVATSVGEAVQFIPVRPMRTMRGFARGIDTSVERDDDDRA